MLLVTLATWYDWKTEEKECRKMKNIQLLCCDHKTPPCCTLFLPLTHPKIYSLISNTVDRGLNLHTSLMTLMHMELCRTTVGLQTPCWPQECEHKHFVCTYTHTHIQYWSREDFGMLQLFMYSFPGGIKGKWSETGRQRKGKHLLSW